MYMYMHLVLHVQCMYMYIHVYLDCATSHRAQEPLATPPTMRLLLGDQSTDKRGGVNWWVWLQTSSVIIGTSVFMS